MCRRVRKLGRGMGEETGLVFTQSTSFSVENSRLSLYITGNFTGDSFSGATAESQELVMDRKARIGSAHTQCGKSNSWHRCSADKCPSHTETRYRGKSHCIEDVCGGRGRGNLGLIQKEQSLATAYKSPKPVQQVIYLSHAYWNPRPSSSWSRDQPILYLHTAMEPHVQSPFFPFFNQSIPQGQTMSAPSQQCVTKTGNVFLHRLTYVQYVQKHAEGRVC